MPSPQLLGVDFTSTPSRRKPITIARGSVDGAVLRLADVVPCSDWPSFEECLAASGPWLGAFDFPFGLPRPFVDAMALGADAAAVARSVRQLFADRATWRAAIDAWGNTQPAGQRLPHRATDRSLGDGLSSTSPLQTRYVPVGLMYFEGLPRLLAAGLHLPGLQDGDRARIAVEGYPGALAHALIGRRSYKNGDDAARLIARKDLVDALEQGRVPGTPRLKLTHAQRDALVADAAGDRLDAVLCLMQAAWASARPDHGVPEGIDPVEGWIVTPRSP